MGRMIAPYCIVAIDPCGPGYFSWIWGYDVWLHGKRLGGKFKNYERALAFIERHRTHMTTQAQIASLFEISESAVTIEGKCGSIDLLECHMDIHFSVLEKLATILGTRMINIRSYATEADHSDVTPGSHGGAFIEWEVK